MHALILPDLHAGDMCSIEHVIVDAVGGKYTFPALQNMAGLFGQLNTSGIDCFKHADANNGS